MFSQKDIAPFIFLIIAIISCNRPTSNAEKHTGYIIIDVQPFSGISTDEKIYVNNELKKIYPYIELKNSIELTPSAFYPPRNRYRADSLIRYLSRNTIGGHVTIGLTNKDISTTNGNIADWGIMGLGFCPGNACIASTFRLSRNEKLTQLLKVAIHELGHTQGLDHCRVKSCFMRDAEGKNTTNDEKDFCTACRSFLVKKGWQFKQ